MAASRDEIGGSRWVALVLALAALLVSAQCQRDKKKHQGKSDPRAESVPRKVRPPAVAGGFYPGDPDQLRGEVDRLLADAPAPETEPKGTIRAIMVPHAGYRFSGRGAATGFRLVRGRSYARVVVLGPSHHGGFTGLSIAEVTDYQTPLGDVPLDLAAVATLRESSLVHASSRAHQKEHSIEVQLPFLQRALEPGWKLVPILVGPMERERDYAAAAQLIRPLLDDHTLLVSSGDFTHYGKNYGYSPFPPDDEVAERLRRLDFGFFARVAAGDATGLAAYRADTGITACAFGPASIVANLEGDGSTLTRVGYYTSGSLGDDYESSVSYLTAVLTDDQPLAREGLRKSEMELLHRLACRSLTKAVRPEADPPLSPELADRIEADPRLELDSGAFVTLNERGSLRGCIGHIEPHEALYKAVIDNAANAALRDTRFRPVTADELSALEVEVSVLSPLREISSYQEFQIGQGIVLEKNHRRAVYLPEVAVEQQWDREMTLSHLSRKAGLDRDAWRNGTRFWVFSSQKYSAPYHAE